MRPQQDTTRRDVRVRPVQALKEALVRVGGQEALGPDEYAVTGLRLQMFPPAVYRAQQGAAASTFTGSRDIPVC